MKEQTKQPVNAPLINEGGETAGHGDETRFDEAAEAYCNKHQIVWPNKVEIKTAYVVSALIHTKELQTALAEKDKQLEAFKNTAKRAQNHLMNLQPHIANLEKRKQPFIDAHVDLAIEALSEIIQEN